MRRAVSLLLLLTGALAAPVSSAAAFPDATFGNQCQYSYDRYWRPVPMIFGGTLTDGAGKELASGTRLAVGDTVRLQGGTVSAVLPSWILPFAYDSGMIALGDGELPVRAWLALEATNTAEGVTAPIALTTVARTHVEVTASNQVDEERSSIVVVQAPVPTQTWTATGGEVRVRQAVGESLPPIPVGRDGADVRVRGSLFVEASLSGDLKLFMDCLQGDQVAQGSSFSDALPGTLGVFAVPGWSGAVDGVPVSGAVDADVLLSQAPPRAEVGEGASMSGATLRLRLTEAQRTAWLGSATSVPVTGAVVVHGARSAEGNQSVPVSRTIAVGASGPVTVSLPLAASTWTSAGDDGIDLRSDRVISLDAAVGGATRTLTLTRVTAADPYPFARLLRSVAPTPIVAPAPTAVAVPTAAPVAPVVPAPAPAGGGGGGEARGGIGALDEAQGRGAARFGVAALHGRDRVSRDGPAADGGEGAARQAGQADRHARGRHEVCDAGGSHGDRPADPLAGRSRAADGPSFGARQRRGSAVRRRCGTANAHAEAMRRYPPPATSRRRASSSSSGHEKHFTLAGVR